MCPLVMTNIALEIYTIFHGKIRYFYGFFEKICNNLPEGRVYQIYQEEELFDSSVLNDWGNM